MAYADDLRKDRDRARVLAGKYLRALRDVLPMAESYMKGAPSHPDNAKLEDARALVASADREIDRLDKAFS